MKIAPIDCRGARWMAVALTAGVALIAGNSHANEAEDQAQSFMNIYSSTCLKYLTNLSALRDKLKSVPTLPQEKASSFLNGTAGDAWPVPDKYGFFVLAIPANKNMCIVYARKADTNLTERSFKQLVEKAPQPLESKARTDVRRDTDANGPTHTLSYEWSVPSTSRKMLFTLTTASSNNAQLQVMGSAAMVSE